MSLVTYGYDGVTPRVASATYPNGQTSLYSYFPNATDRRLQRIHHKTPGGATLSKFDYTYSVVGNILTWQQQADASAPVRWEYGYDVADQLVAAVKKATDPQQTVLARHQYRYDAGGNRTAEQIDNAVTGATYDTVNRLVSHTVAGVLRVAGQLDEPAAVTVDGVVAAVDATNRFVGTKQLTTGTNTFTVAATDPAGNVQTKTYQVDAAGASRTFTYDANGNMTGDGTRTFEWDAENRLVAVNNGIRRSEFAYDGYDRRVRIVEKESSVTVRDADLFWAGTDIIEERLTTGVITRFFADGEQHNGAPRYLTRDHLGSVREVTDTAGVVVTRNEYDPYGRPTRVSGTEDSRFGYTGHMAHGASGLALAMYRAYDPTTGRWLSEDPEGLIDGANMTLYSAQNPVRYVDPLGLYTLKPGVPEPSAEMDAILRHIEQKTGLDLLVTSTSETTKPHPPNTPHGRGEAVDVRYGPSDRDRKYDPKKSRDILDAAAEAGAGYAQDEYIHPSPNSTGPHIHIQKPRGTRGGRGDLPAKPKRQALPGGPNPCKN